MDEQNKRIKENNIRTNVAIVLAVIALIIAILFCLFIISGLILPCQATGCGIGYGFSMAFVIAFPPMFLLASKMVEPVKKGGFLNDKIITKMKIAKYCRIITILLTVISIFLFFNSYR